MSTTIDTIEHHETECPEHCAALTKEYDIELNPNGRKPKPGHRPECTPTQIELGLVDLLQGGFGLGAQIVAYRRVRGIKLAQRTKWRAAALDLLTDVAQLIDLELPRSRAQRFAEQCDVRKAATILQEWVYAE